MAFSGEATLYLIVEMATAATILIKVAGSLVRSLRLTIRELRRLKMVFHG